MNSWTEAEAAANFDDLVEKAKTHGPQIVTRDGKPALVVVSIEEPARKSSRRGSLLQFFAESPLVDSGIVIERRRSAPREIDL